MILNSLVGKKVRILWVDAQTDADDFEILAFDPSTGWVCMRRLAKPGTPPESCLPTMVRQDDIDQIVIIDPTYNPKEFNQVINGIAQAMRSGQQDAEKPGVTSEVTEQIVNGASAIRATMSFDLPKAGEEFYLCSRANNAFGVLWEMGVKFRKDLEKNNYKTPNEAIKKLYKFMINELDEADINIQW